MSFFAPRNTMEPLAPAASDERQPQIAKSDHPIATFSLDEIKKSSNSDHEAVTIERLEPVASYTLSNGNTLFIPGTSLLENVR